MALEISLALQKGKSTIVKLYLAYFPSMQNLHWMNQENPRELDRELAEDVASDSAKRPADNPSRKQRNPRKITAKYLERAALHYLERYAASVDQLRRVLQRRVIKSARFHSHDPKEGFELIEQLLIKLQEARFLDDRIFAASRARGRHNRGQSARAIAAYLKTKGIDDEDISAALEERAEGQTNPELAAALTYCRKRRSGPYRPEEIRQENLKRDLAALARQGFSYDLARRIVEGDVRDLEAELE